MNIGPNDQTRSPRAPVRRLGISTALFLIFGSLILLAVAVVLALGVWSGRENTLTLLRDKAQSTIEFQVAKIHQTLEPAADQLDYLAPQLESGRIEIALEPDSALASQLSGALSATPHVRAILFMSPENQGLIALRRSAGADIVFIESIDPVARAALKAARGRKGTYWGEVVRPSSRNQTLINVRRPIYVEGKFSGLLAATVKVGQLSIELEEAAIGIGANGFLLLGDDLVLAHRDIASGIATPPADAILPTVESLGDKVIKAFVNNETGRHYGKWIDEAMGIQTVSADGRDYAVLTAKLDMYSAKPWLVGLYLPAAALGDEISRLRWAGIAGLVVLVIALAITWQVSRHLSRPLNRLARAAERVTALELAGIEELPAGRLAEPARAALAFNAMVEALRWFEAYVPRRLVRQLLAEGGSAVATSTAREVTVLFTDIVGFTDQAETMRAEETADFLNAHFTVLANCVEAEDGTIDKFIGDSMMAFWGAPDAQGDHALRACRAALEMREAIAADNALRTAAGLAPIRVRVGLHSGEVIVGNIGTAGRLNYTIVGDVVNAASRLENLGRDDAEATSDVTITLSGATLAAAGAPIQGRPRGQHLLRGRREKISVYAL